MKKVVTMRKLLTALGFAAPALISAAASAAPAELVCADANARNCFKDEIFLLDGNTTYDKGGTQTPIVGCASSTDCYLTATSELFNQTGLQIVIGKALEQIKAK